MQIIVLKNKKNPSKRKFGIGNQVLENINLKITTVFFYKKFFRETFGAPF